MALEYLNLLIPVPRPTYLCGSIHSKLHCPIKTNGHCLPGKSSKIEVKYNMAVGPIRKQLLWNLMLLIMTEAESFKN
jgi:hypothetical protein